MQSTRNFQFLVQDIKPEAKATPVVTVIPKKLVSSVILKPLK